MEPGPQFHQLAMFHTARDLVDPSKTMPAVFPNAVRDADRLKGEWGRTLQEAKQPRDGSGRSSLHAHIKARGISSPVTLRDNHLGTQTITNGHHRVAVAHDISPNYLVPVEHFR